MGQVIQMRRIEFLPFTPQAVKHYRQAARVHQARDRRGAVVARVHRAVRRVGAFLLWVAL
jgi:hypothetical protein